METRPALHASFALVPLNVIDTLLGSKEWKNILFDKVSNCITRELTGLCTLSWPSLLRQKAKEELVNLKWSDIYDELSERWPYS